MAEQGPRRQGGWRRLEWVLWAGVLGVVVFVQWPMIAGTFYRVTGTAAPASAITWRTDFRAALAEARAAGRPVLVDFSADWCSPCVAMKHDVWPDRQVARLVNASYIPLLVDVDRDPDTASHYGISGIPTVLVLDPAGQVMRRAAYLPRAGMVRFLTEGGR